MPRLRQHLERGFPVPWRRVARLVAPTVAILTSTLAAADPGARPLEEAIAAGDQHYAAARLDEAVHDYAEALPSAPGREKSGAC